MANDLIPANDNDIDDPGFYLLYFCLLLRYVPVPA